MEGLPCQRFARAPVGPGILLSAHPQRMSHVRIDRNKSCSPLADRVRAEELARAGRTIEAIALFERIVEANPLISRRS